MIEKNSVSPSISSLRKVLGGIPMSMVEFFSEEILQEIPTQVVYKANELIDISDGAVTMKLVGRAHPSRAITFLNEIYRLAPILAKNAHPRRRRNRDSGGRSPGIGRRS
jgi:hypothetical protein